MIKIVVFNMDNADITYETKVEYLPDVGDFMIEHDGMMPSGRVMSKAFQFHNGKLMGVTINLDCNVDDRISKN